MPLQRRLPKRGFVNIFRKEYFPVNVGEVALAFGAGETVDVAALVKKGMVPRKATRVKVLGNGSIAHGVTVKAQGFSKSAREKIVGAGGSVVVVDPVKHQRRVAPQAAE